MWLEDIGVVSVVIPPPKWVGACFAAAEPNMSTDPRFGGLYSISTSQGALADSAPIRQHRRSIATIKALQESASEGSLYPSVAVKPELAQDWQANVSQQDGFHSASVLREPIGMLTPYVENELTRSIKNMGRQHGMNGRRASEAPPSADGDAPTKVLMRTQLLPSAVVRDLWRTSKKPLSNEIVKARAAAEAKARGANEAKVAAMPTESERCAEGARAVMEAKTRMGMCYDEYLSENPLLSSSVTTDDFFSRGMEWTGAPRHHLPCIPLHPLPSRTPTCLSTQVSPPPHLTGTSAHARTRREHQLQRAEMRVRTQQGSLLRLGDYAEADFDREFARQTVEYLLWQCPNSAPVPRGAPDGSGRLNTSMVAVLKPPGAWPTASDPRARRRHSRRFCVAFAHPDAALRDDAGRARQSEGVGGAREAQGVLRDHLSSGARTGVEVELQSGYALGCWAWPGRTRWSKGRYPAPCRCGWWQEKARPAAADLDQQHVGQSSRPPRLAQSAATALGKMIRGAGH